MKALKVVVAVALFFIPFHVTSKKRSMSKIKVVVLENPTEVARHAANMITGLVIQYPEGL